MSDKSEGVVLVVDDEPKIRRLLQVALEAKGYKVIEADDGRKAIESCALHHPDVVLLDLGLPTVDGLDIIRRVREWTAVPIIVVSVRDREDDKITALDAGADDYLTKPFSMGELMARIRVAIRHQLDTEDSVLTLGGDLEIDRANHSVRRGNIEIHLTPTEFRLLATLAAHPGRVMTHNQLLRAVWGLGYESEMRYLRVYIALLRQKIEDDPAHPKYILTEPRIGYRVCNN